MADRRDPRTVDLSRRLGHAASRLNSGDVAGAKALCNELIRHFPHSGDAHHLLALCHVKVGDVVSAEAAFDAALRTATGSAGLHFNFTKFLRSLGRDSEAAVALRQAIRLEPNSADAWVELALVELSLRDLPSARRAAEEAVRLAPDMPRAWHAMGSINRASGDLEGAERAFRSAIKFAPDRPDLWVNLGVVTRLLGRSQQSLGFYRRARELGFEGPDVEDAEVGALLDLGRVDEALDQARTLVERYPRFAPGHRTLANVLWEHGERQGIAHDPLGALLDAIRRYPDVEPLKFELVRLLAEAGRPEEALTHIRSLRALRDQPQLARLEADTLESIGEHVQAHSLYRQIERDFGDNDPSYLNAYARHLLRRGDIALAATVAERATRLAPRNQEAWAYLGTAWRVLGDAREEWLCGYERLVGTTEVEVPDGFTGMADFLTALKASLLPLHAATREPMRQSLRGGSQTSGRLFGREDPAIQSVEQAMRRAVERWLGAQTPDPSHPFLAHLSGSFRFSGSWSVQLRSSGRHVNHIHSEGWLSSAFYVSLPSTVLLPESAFPQAGYIGFGQPPEELGLALEPRKLIRPEPGRLVLFPSYLWHGTVPFHGEEPRTTIAFDVVPA